MAGRRWISSGGLLVLAGGSTALSTWRHWSSCRPDTAARACLALRDETYGLPLWAGTADRDPTGTALAALAALLLVLAWLRVAGWARRSPARTALAAVVGGQPLLVALLVALQLTFPSRPLIEITGWLTWPAEVLVLPLLLGAGWIVDEAPLPTIRLILLGWGVASFGPVHLFVDHVITSLITGGAESSPPGLGYVTAGTQIALGMSVVVLTLVLERRKPPEEGDERSGRDGFTLAA